jgi:DNA-binding NarL/FixJ family response regulator
MAPSPVRQEWLQRLVAGARSIRVMGIAPTFPYLRSLITETSPDLALIDLASGIDSSIVREWLIELRDQIPILVLSFDPDPAIFNLILNGEAGGMLPADASSQQIIHTIEAISSGLMVFDGDLVTREAGTIAPAESLTPRESEVLALLAEGLGNKEIAHRLNISEHTIKFHIGSILAKLGASSRTEAVSLGLRGGLIEL